MSHHKPQRFSVGICASDLAPQLPSLIRFLRASEYGEDFSLEKVVVVASGCPLKLIASAKEAAAGDSRIALIVEDERNGKAEAINRILQETKGEFLVMLNADTFPSPNAIGEILQMITDPRVGAVSAMPVFEDSGGLLRHSLSLMWGAHSQLSLKLNHAGLSNHACDELIVVRKSLVTSLPVNVVNDGAYIGGLVRARGYQVRFSTAAKVKIAVPTLLIDLVRQRRRIIYGHVQVWKKIGRPPRTLESMMFIDPMTSLKTLVRVLSQKPRLILAMPVVAAGESISVLMGLVDAMRSTDMHIVWRRNVE
ncbi:MAG TPA: glycosyltransferase [Nitrososphaerales archaeon]|nr:glycosyltransferase [Nitrososphaerales archaeon]